MPCLAENDLYRGCSRRIKGFTTPVFWGISSLGKNGGRILSDECGHFPVSQDDHPGKILKLIASQQQPRILCDLAQILFSIITTECGTQKEGYEERRK
jgi:hypothetical protein